MARGRKNTVRTHLFLVLCTGLVAFTTGCASSTGTPAGQGSSSPRDILRSKNGSPPVTAPRNVDTDVTDATEQPTPPTAPAASAFPSRNVRQTDNGIVANAALWGEGWPWTTPNVVMACSDAVSGGAYLSADDGKNYLLTGSIIRQGFISGNAGVDLWNQESTDALAEWLDAATRLCPDGG